MTLNEIRECLKNNDLQPISDFVSQTMINNKMTYRAVYGVIANNSSDGNTIITDNMVRGVFEDNKISLGILGLNRVGEHVRDIGVIDTTKIKNIGNSTNKNATPINNNSEIEELKKRVEKLEEYILNRKSAVDAPNDYDFTNIDYYENETHQTTIRIDRGVWTKFVELAKNKPLVKNKLLLDEMFIEYIERNKK